MIQTPEIKISDLKAVLSPPELKVLSLSINNGLTSKEFAEILKRPDLEGLDLIQSKQLKPEEYGALAKFKKLDYLEIDDCQLNKEKLAQISRIESLTFLRIKNEKNLGTEPMKPFVQNHSNLKTLNFKSVQLPDEALADIARLDHLKVLFLSATPTTDKGIELLVANKSRVKNLSFTETQITRSGFLKLSKLKKLEEVYLGENKNFNRIEAEQLARTVKFKVSIEKNSTEEYQTLFDLSPHD